MRSLTAVLLLLLALGVPACGGDDDDGGDNGPQPVEQAHEEAQGGSSGEGEAEVQAALRNAATAMETCYAEEQDYTRCTAERLDAEGVEFGSAPGQVQVANATADAFTLTALAESDTRFELAREPSGQIVRTCSEPGQGQCTDDGSW